MGRKVLKKRFGFSKQKYQRKIRICSSEFLVFFKGSIAKTFDMYVIRKHLETALWKDLIFAFHENFRLSRNLGLSRNTLVSPFQKVVFAQEVYFDNFWNLRFHNCSNFFVSLLVCRYFLYLVDGAIGMFCKASKLWENTLHYFYKKNRTFDPSSLMIPALIFSKFLKEGKSKFYRAIESSNQWLQTEEHLYEIFSIVTQIF